MILRKCANVAAQGHSILTYMPNEKTGLKPELLAAGKKCCMYSSPLDMSCSRKPSEEYSDLLQPEVDDTYRMHVYVYTS